MFLARGRVGAVSDMSSLCEHSVFCTAEGKPLSELSTPTEKVGGAPAPAESVFGIFKFGEGFGAVPLPESQLSDRSTPTESSGGAPASDGTTGKKKKKTKKKKRVVMHGWSHTPLVRQLLIDARTPTETSGGALDPADDHRRFEAELAVLVAGSIANREVPLAVADGVAAAVAQIEAELAVRIVNRAVLVAVEDGVAAAVLELQTKTTAPSAPVTMQAAVPFQFKAAADAPAATPATIPTRSRRIARAGRARHATQRCDPAAEAAKPQHAHKAVPAENAATPAATPLPTTPPSSTTAVDRAPVPNAMRPSHPPRAPPKDLARCPAATPPPQTPTNTPPPAQARAQVPVVMCTSDPPSTPPETPTRDPAAPSTPPKSPNPNRSPNRRRRRQRRDAPDPTGKCSRISKPSTPPDESSTSSAPPPSPQRRRRRRRRRRKTATDVPATPNHSTRRRRRRRRRRRSSDPIPPTKGVDRPRPTQLQADAPLFTPAQEFPIWLPSARVLVDAVTGLQFLFLAHPDGRLHPAHYVTHHHHFGLRPSTLSTGQGRSAN